MQLNTTDADRDWRDQALGAMDTSWPQKHVLVVGDVMLDKYIWGEVERISPEAPVPVVRALHNSEHPGGAANVAMNLAGLGARVTVIGFTGNDNDGISLAKLLTAAGVDPALLAVADVPTISKLRILGGAQQMLRLDVEQRTKPPAEAIERLLSAVEEHLNETHAVVLSDYAKGVLSEQVCQHIIGEARRRNLPVLVDPKAADFARYRGATTVSPNAHELATAVRGDWRDLESLFQAAKELLAGLRLDYLTVTLGEKGIAILRPSSRTIAPAVARQVFDVSGAGDTVLAVLALSAAAGMEPEIAIRIANVAAGIVVSKVGTVPILKWELAAALSPPGNNVEQKLATLDDLLGRVAAWRNAGESVAFTNGCFDLLHVGHITMLEQARQQADHLVVGLNSDASIQRLKGPSRPVVREAERARVLGALSSVDAIAIFEEDTPLHLIEAMRPDVLIKGGDYTDATVVGANEVLSWGGRVKIVPTVEGYSTTSLIEKSQRNQ